ncbi:MAG TPA: hypothetical protein VFI14_06990, partial [Chryseosolibacter sp.]|nr:hypothetical protein [Chryseosolibacter sp.]
MSASDEEKRAFVGDMNKLKAMLIHYALVSERLLIFIDNNVIQDILKEGDDAKRRQRFHSLLAFLCLAEDYFLIDVFACISPVILFEAGGKNFRPTTSSVEKVVSNVEQTIAETGLSTLLVGFQSAKQLVKIFSQIASDEKRIRHAVDEVLAQTWKREFSLSYGDGIRIPFSLAEEECPDIRLQYFHPWYVKLILIHMIEKRMYNENKDQAKARSLMRKGKSTAFSILKKKGDGVEG